MYKLVATDCDGTFIDSKGWLPEENKIAFQRLHQRGIPVVLVTGRNDFLTKDYVDELGFQCPVIGGNGATLGNIYTGERKYVNAMTKDEMNGVFDICDKFKVPCKVFTTEKCYTNDIDLKNGGIKLITVKYTKPIKTTIENVLETDIRKTADFKNVIKVVVIEDNIEFLTEIKDAINEKVKTVTAIQSNWNCIDIVKKGVSKGAALLKYGEMLGIKPEDIIAFGDSENDVSMIKAVGGGYAIGNADQCVKDVAKYIADTNDNCGVAKVLDKEFNLGIY